jgi:serine/threonine-protein kinase
MASLEAALAGNLPADEEGPLHRHLEDCEECSAALERMAGGTGWCQEAASLLNRDELDAATFPHVEWSDVDFTVEHLEAADEPNVLGRLGGYDVLEIIGRGGMSVVLKGFDRELKRFVAIKVLAPHLAQSSLARKRFAREARAAAAVVHPHVLAIHQVQPNGRLPFLVMPLVAGESLAERLAAQGTLELKEILRIGMQAATGLAAAHEQGLVHRDVKPANILLEKGVERAVLTDFGLARAADDIALTRWGIIAGTPEYMSPEQARGEPVDGRSDLFSLGCVLYEMATGVSPFRTDSVMATMRRLVDDAPRALAALNPELPSWFIAIVDRLLEKEPSRRFPSAKEVSQLLEGCLAHVQHPAAVPLPASLATHHTPSGRLLYSHRKGVIAMLGVVGFTWLGIMVWQASKPADNPLPGSNSNSPPPAQGADSQPKTKAAPKRIHQFQISEKVNTLAYAADGKWIAVANGNPTFVLQTNGKSRVVDDWQPSAEILDAAIGKTVVSLKLTTNEEDTLLAATERVPPFEVEALAFSPDGNVVAVGTSVGQVKLFSARTGELVRSLDDVPAKRADQKTPEKLKSLTRAMGSVASLAFSPDGSLLATCGGSMSDVPLVLDRVERGLTRRVTGPGRLKLWEVKTGKLKHDLAGHSQVDAVAFSPDGKWLASAGRWQHAHEWGTGVILWNPQDGKKMRTFEKEANGGTHAVAFSPNSKRLVFASRHFDKENDTSTTAISLAYTQSGIMDWQLTVPGWAKPKAFSPDGKSVAVLCHGQSIRFLDTESGTLKHVIQSANSPEGGRWNDLAIAPEVRRLVIGGVDADKRGVLTMWDLDGAAGEGR